jgi:trehalose utilization protein
MTPTDAPTRVLVWNENVRESRGELPAAHHYPDGIHTVIKEALDTLLGDRVEVDTATLDEPEHGLTESRLARTEVLIWWGHVAHDRVEDAIVDRVVRHVHAGMGLLVLHSGHFSKVFTRLMGTTCSLRWRNDGDSELLWTVAPTHPIASGVPHPVTISGQEMYGEYFDIPRPDDIVFLSTFSGGEVFRSGVTFTRGLGRVFYFSPGDEDYPVYHHPDIQTVLANAVRWAGPTLPRSDLVATNVPWRRSSPLRTSSARLHTRGRGEPQQLLSGIANAGGHRPAAPTRSR